MSGNNKQYIGDGVYARWDGADLVLTTEVGLSTPTNEIVLEPVVWKMLQDYCSRTVPNLG